MSVHIIRRTVDLCTNYPGVLLDLSVGILPLPVQAAARDRLRRQQQELEVMRTRLLQSEEHRDIRRELSHVRNEVTR